jgi:hypothetical protein
MLVKINVTKPIAIPNHNQRSVDLKRGVHEIEEAYLDHWYVKALMQQGIITIVKSGPKVVFKPLPTMEEKKAAPVIQNYRPVIGQVTINKIEEKPAEVIPAEDKAPVIDEIVEEEKVIEKSIVETKVKEAEPVVTKVIKRRKK